MCDDLAIERYRALDVQYKELKATVKQKDVKISELMEANRHLEGCLEAWEQTQ